MVRISIPKLCLYGEDAYTIEGRLHGRCDHTIDTMRVRVFTALFHIWYARGYSSICFVVTRVPLTYLSLEHPLGPATLATTFNFREKVVETYLRAKLTPVPSVVPSVAPGFGFLKY